MNRRMGPPGSPVWHRMLDGAEAILQELGYGALTSRSVADHIGVKQRLVYYYFRSMDDLIVETFRRLAARELERLDGALTGDNSLHEVWNVCVHTADTRMVAEFMALANRIDALRQEVVAYIETTRRIQVSALEKAFSQDQGGPMPTAAMAILVTSAALTLHREAAIGVSMGHAEVTKVIEDFIARYEPETR
ncbi:TetR/AcrR family transcriptional regulator [Novosphingobium mangrovi (ex Huang et al. 2023)]|uniref:TetR/AcrR family transcriptional regulator n=1 Tax=Novosphingobium mangrovi (ex Huang et al. 2023) TaxID=2976432 RepID=A0ABT2I5Q9_9SPHN|nr:TetR/AcrR family transcriptional regulator [Novosphingobium mangrovi (ex Huang et al. 2023)]MCT2399882.1 TetR/AcrR family transcriptional regulator [Novosphingobium mangrovi (ex Huang et al. 2023)]